ncbi:oligogalacturonate lyase [Deinococcus seoulensis]|uniref:Oligogalacturonate lyase n=1 Tax=Deinococcus seoulensis TaxID=1837379 RepID=A0ABQ2RYF9_9DEIO|nr:oligogalacturonate lyase family protein [Deinococcus seoulensis]GGR75004.1 oligogalacturonate lyase [Deinococcus seoulensis]
MAKGDTVQLDVHEFRDPDTGAPVTRLTPPDVVCHRNYFYQKCFTADGNGLLFGAGLGSRTPGEWNTFLLDLPGRTARQLTEGPGDNTFGCFLSPDDRSAFVMRGGRDLLRVNLRTLREDVVYSVPDGYVGYGTWVANSACTRMVGIEVVDGDLLPLTSWAGFHEQFLRPPRCRLIVIDLSSGERRVIREERRWLGHPIYRPHHDQTVAYCHEGPHDLIDARMWLIDEDGRNNRQVKEQEPGESCTHEFWVPDGSRLIYVSYRRGQQDRFICAADPVTLRNEVLMTMPPCSHLMSNERGTLLVGDGSGTPADVADPGEHQVQNDPFLYLFDLEGRQTTRLAGHHSSWEVRYGSRQVTHPHPSFTPDERQVLFTSDMHGEPALYLVDLPGT